MAVSVRPCELVVRCQLAITWPAGALCIQCQGSKFYEIAIDLAKTIEEDSETKDCSDVFELQLSQGVQPAAHDSFECSRSTIH